MRIEDRLTLYRLHMTDINRGGYVKEEVKDEDVTTIADDSAMDVDETGPLIPDIKAEPTSPNMNRTLLGLPNDCGVQSKMVRCAIIHEILYHFVYSFDNFEGLPNVYERFPPALSVDEIKAEEVPVYVDADTPTRFMPPLPPFSNAQQGWFMLQDFLNVFPLSVYVLLMPLPKNCPDVHNYLVDPFRRHTILGDLPLHIRMPLLKDKKFVKYLEHVILCLCSYGLMRQMPNPDVRRFNSAHSAVFYVAKEAILMDTSTSEKGYSTVSPAPHPDGYTQHHYKFKSEKDIQFYWHHLRAIALSTPLSFRQVKKGDETIQLNTSNHGSAQDARNNYRKYAMGTFDRSQIMGDPSEEYSVVLPIKPNDGCAGFACDLFVHLKRHWDLNPRPGEYISWFINKWRNDAENARDHVESRVEKLQSHWNSFIIALMPSDMEMVKRYTTEDAEHVVEIGDCKDDRDSTHGRIKKLRPFALRMHKTPQEKASRGNKTKKRKLDEIDMLSETRRMFLRSRFSAKERDMLVLIRAVSFFLNPVYRFWLNPVVLRDIMHDLVPESRCKTVQSLMAAGVRELARPYRLDYMQRIVKILCTFDEMRNLREQLFNNPLVDPEEKRKFFLDAFLAANRLLFIPHSDILCLIEVSSEGILRPASLHGFQRRIRRSDSARLRLSDHRTEQLRPNPG
ncbi:hypothetical protein L596_017498 [Steinernema carpocapsae]|nr:hypothetical protein L596_017498 [Steinernema carpocapsae]